MTESAPVVRARRSDSVSPIRAAPRREPVQARAEETRARILIAARIAFAENGFAGTNIREIATASGVTHSMVTYHFGTKDELWREAVTEMFAVLDREVFAVLAQSEHASPADECKAFIRLYTRYCAAHPEHARMMVSESIRGGERLAWLVERFVKDDHASRIPWLEALMDDGSIPRMPGASFLYATVGMMQLPFILAEEARLTIGHDFMSDAAIESHTEAVLSLVFQHADSPKKRLP